jgi:shikimate dehydrogenase
VISASTRLVALIGHPVAHSLSPRMQNAAFAARGLDWAYVACDVAPERLDEAVRGLAALGVAGANVTTPHKLAVTALCDEVDAAGGSVNTLVFRDERIVGFSTDAEAVRGLAARRPVVIGDGGAARAFAAALPGARVFSRGGAWPPDTADADLVVNATPVAEELLFEPRARQTIIELPYPESATARAARDAGSTVIDVLDVLVAQGAASFERWTGVPAPVDVMRAAVRPGS